MGAMVELIDPKGLLLPTPPVRKQAPGWQGSAIRAGLDALADVLIRLRPKPWKP